MTSRHRVRRLGRWLCHLPFPRQETGEPMRLYCCPSPATLAWSSWIVLAEGRQSTAAIGPGNSVQTQPHHFRPNMSLTVPSSWGKVGVLVQHKRTKSSAMCVTLRLPGSNHRCHTTFHVAGKGTDQSRRMQSGRRCLSSIKGEHSSLFHAKQEVVSRMAYSHCRRYAFPRKPQYCF